MYIYICIYIYIHMRMCVYINIWMWTKLFVKSNAMHKLGSSAIGCKDLSATGGITHRVLV